MKIAKVFAALFGAVGTVLLAGSVGLCLVCRNAEPKIERIPEGAVQCAAALESALERRDYAALEDCLYGQPELGLTQAPADPMVAMVWQRAQEVLRFSWEGECYFDGSAFCRDAAVSYVELTAVTDTFAELAHALLTREVENATEMAQLYDEDGQFRQELMDRVLEEALTQACREHADAITVPVTVRLVCEDGSWFAVPEGALFTALSAGME